ncbi:MAG: hypothetical protein DMG13_15545 [Acidobacteria bacterium]|nr:MAG: hypothetical protein DMG13_15545 [Acidobacteriota bacterium]
MSAVYGAVTADNPAIVTSPAVREAQARQRAASKKYTAATVLTRMVNCEALGKAGRLVIYDFVAK